MDAKLSENPEVDKIKSMEREHLNWKVKPIDTRP
jgi:hypothetical protein